MSGCLGRSRAAAPICSKRELTVAMMSVFRCFIWWAIASIASIIPSVVLLVGGRSWWWSSSVCFSRFSVFRCCSGFHFGRPRIFGAAFVFCFAGLHSALHAVGIAFCCVAFCEDEGLEESSGWCLERLCDHGGVCCLILWSRVLFGGSLHVWSALSSRPFSASRRHHGAVAAVGSGR